MTIRSCPKIAVIYLRKSQIEQSTVALLGAAMHSFLASLAY